MQLAKPAIARHVVSWKVYLTVFVALCMLTTVSVAVTSFDFGPLNLVVALGVALAKSSLVILYFMHARHSLKFTGVVLAAALGFFVILVFLTWTDYGSRPWLPTNAG